MRTVFPLVPRLGPCGCGLAVCLLLDATSRTRDPPIRRSLPRRSDGDPRLHRVCERVRGVLTLASNSDDDSAIGNNNGFQIAVLADLLIGRSSRTNDRRILERGDDLHGIDVPLAAAHERVRREAPRRSGEVFRALDLRRPDGEFPSLCREECERRQERLPAWIADFCLTSASVDDHRSRSYF